MHALELKVPPPLVALAFAVFATGLAALLPARWAVGFDTTVLALVIAGAGLCCDVAALWAFRCARTTINPLTPAKTRALVVSGIYRYSRNPMYLGLACLLSSWIIYLGQGSLFALVLAFMWYLNRFQIVPEERMLQALFGGRYQAWMQRVPRWLFW